MEKNEGIQTSKHCPRLVYVHAKKKIETAPLKLLLLTATGLLLGRLLGHLLLPRNGSLDSNAAKHQTNTQPLHLGQAVAKGDNREDHGEHLACDRDRDQEDRGECRERVD